MIKSNDPFGWPVFNRHNPYKLRAFENTKRPVLLLFSDDSTLFFCLRLRKLLQDCKTPHPIELVWYMDESALSYRQVSLLLPEGPDQYFTKGELTKVMRDPNIEAVITSRVYRPLQNLMATQAHRLYGDRPCLIAFLGGLEFTPEKGYYNRRNCDAVYLFPQSALTTYRNKAVIWDNGWQEVGFGHPHFLMPKLAPTDLKSRKDIYFFTQAISPLTKRSRLQMLKAMIAIARGYPDRIVWIKLRHLPHENQAHLHLEKHSYPDLLATLTDVPENLRLTACTMDEALETAALGITCTSTAAIDVVRSGIPAMVYLDFVDNYRDPLMPPMRDLFETSGLITSLEDMLNLRTSSPNPEWVADMFCPRDLGERIFQTIERFKKRAFQLKPKP